MTTGANGVAFSIGVFIACYLSSVRIPCSQPRSPSSSVLIGGLLLSLVCSLVAYPVKSALLRVYRAREIRDLVVTSGETMASDAPATRISKYSPKNRKQQPDTSSSHSFDL
jgi:hypothetical protein